MEPHRDDLRGVDIAVDEGEVAKAVEGRGVGDHPQLADCAPRIELADPFNEVFALLAPCDQIRNRNPCETVLPGKGVDLWPLHNRAVVVRELADHPDLRQAGERAEVDRGLGMTGAHQHAAFSSDERKDVTGADEVLGAHVGVGEGTGGVGALLGRDASGQPMNHVDRDGEGGAKRRVVRRDHGREVQRAGARFGQRRADDAAGVPDDEGHFLGRAK